MIKKIVHIILAGLIFVSTTGFRINMHYCHDQLIDLAFFSPAHSCCEMDGMDMNRAVNSINQMDHCKDKSITVESTDDYVGSFNTFHFENTPAFDLLFTASILFNDQFTQDPFLLEPPWHKEPPPYTEVVLSKIQTYLI